MIQAEPFNIAETGSMGRASYMLQCQHNFPYFYNRNLDQLCAADHDRLMGDDFEHANRCFQKHTGVGELSLASWLSQATDDKIMAFLKDILKADKAVVWTGYRVMYTVHRGNGAPVWTLQLFAKHPHSTTEVYTGSQAPNVLPGPRH
jgi:hypothetical protein